jgi:hypothetical protein
MQKRRYVYFTHFHFRDKFPNRAVESVYLSEDQIYELDTTELVCDCLSDNDAVYFGKAPPNEVIIGLRAYQTELLAEAEKSNRYVK